MLLKYCLGNVALFSDARTGHHRNSDRSNNRNLYCNGAYAQNAVNAVAAGHMLRQVAKQVRIIMMCSMLR